jgi:LacI family gluconate utilization system Gnt-I transcriptional repressor
MTVTRALQRAAQGRRRHARAASSDRRAPRLHPGPHCARPHAAADRLVGAVVPLLTNSLIAEIVQGLSRHGSPATVQLLIGATASRAGEETNVRAFLSRRVDAIYLTGITNTKETRG